MARTSKIVFFGSPDFALPSLNAVIESGRKVELVVTKPDRPKGRGQKTSPPVVACAAIEAKIPLFQPASLRTKDAEEFLRKHRECIFIVVAYGNILPRPILDLPEITLNVHGSLLPRWRGAAPIARAIQAGDRVTGVSIMRLVEKLDAGDVLSKSEVPIDENVTAGELTTRLSHEGAKLLVETLCRMDENRETFERQDESLVTYASMLRPEESRIDWSRDVLEVHNHIRAFHPWPGTHTYDSSHRLKILASRIAEGPISGMKLPGTPVQRDQRLYAACGNGWLEVLKIQREGKEVKDARTFLSGYRIDESSRWK